MNDHGEANITHSTVFETIQVAEGWTQYIKGAVLAGSYLGKGLTKYAFLVSDS